MALCECSKHDPTMPLAMLAAGGLLAIWMLFRGGLKMKASNVLIPIAVVVIVGAVAWFRSARQAPTSELTAPASTPVANPAPTPTTFPVKEGELCPEPAPTGSPGSVPVSDPTSPVANPAAPRKLPRVVDLGADKCIPCKKLAPILAELKKEYEGRVIVEVIDVWKNPKAGEPYKIRMIPTQIFFDADGKEVWRHEGFLPKEEFIAKFKELGVK